MASQLNKKYFARNRDRQNVHGALLTKTSRLLTYLLPLILMLFFTPAMIATSLFSKEIIVMVANILLSLGYLTNISFSAYTKELSKTELLISLVLLAAFIATAYFLFPPLAAVNFISLMSFANQISVAVNVFFLLKHTLVPPGKKLVERMLKGLGFNISEQYFANPPLSLKNDRYIIDRLLRKTYNHDSFSPDFREEELISFNNLIITQTRYVNKYNESFLGSLNKQDNITELEKQITQLTINGNPDSSYAFINKKIDFKTSKIKALKSARNELQKDDGTIKDKLRYFKGIKESDYRRNKDKVLHEGLACIVKEISVQKQKRSTLRACLPSDINDMQDVRQTIM